MLALVPQNVKTRYKAHWPLMVITNDLVTQLMGLEGRNQWCLENVAMRDGRQMVFY